MGLVGRGGGLVCQGAMVLDKLKTISVSLGDEEAPWAVIELVLLVWFPQPVLSAFLSSSLRLRPSTSAPGGIRENL